jgi:hypothetical protein
VRSHDSGAGVDKRAENTEASVAVVRVLRLASLSEPLKEGIPLALGEVNASDDASKGSNRAADIDGLLNDKTLKDEVAALGGSLSRDSTPVLLDSLAEKNSSKLTRSGAGRANHALEHGRDGSRSLKEVLEDIEGTTGGLVIGSQEHTQVVFKLLRVGGERNILGDFLLGSLFLESSRRHLRIIVATDKFLKLGRRCRN